MTESSQETGHASDVQGAVLRNRIELMFDQMPVALVSSVVIVSILMVAAWSFSQEYQLGQELIIGLWGGSVVLFLVLRLILARVYKHHKDTCLDSQRWAWIYTAGALMSGGAFGIGAYLLIVDNISVELVSSYALVLVSLILGSVMVHAPYTPAHFWYVMPAALPVMIQVIQHKEWAIRVTGAVVALVLAGSLRMLERARKAMFETMRLRAANEELVRTQSRLIDELIQQRQVAEEARQQAEQARAVADQASAAKTRFFASASHDLRQPVQALLFFAETLRSMTSDAATQHMADNVQTGLNELSLLLGALLDYSKIDAAAVQPRVRETSMELLFQHMAVEFSGQADSQGLVLRVAPCRAWVRSDPVLLERMVRNLMHNALRYTRRGKILLGCRRLPGGRLRIEVHDTGIGIPDNKRDEVFEEFAQLSNPERDSRKGLGLGLAIVKGLSGLLQHPVDMRSQVGLGTCFSITVPLMVPPAQLFKAVPDATEVLTLAHGTLLLVDDNLRLRDAMASMLRRWGYAVRALASGDQAVDLMADTGFEPDAVLVDYRLRDGRTGFDTLSQIRTELGYEVPALMMTGDTDPTIQVQADLAQLQLLHKPVSPTELRVALARLLLPSDPQRLVA